MKERRNDKEGIKEKNKRMKEKANDKTELRRRKDGKYIKWNEIKVKLNQRLKKEEKKKK